MTEAITLFGAEHVRRYRETDGEVGHIWKEGSTILLLTTKGRRTGNSTTAPLIYARDGDRLVIVASQGGAPKHPGARAKFSRTSRRAAVLRRRHPALAASAGNPLLPALRERRLLLEQTVP